MDPGIYTGLAADDYHASPGVSVSRLKRFAQAPALSQFTRPETEALKAGTLRHATVFEPDTVPKLYQLTDEKTVGTKAWKAAAEAADGRTLVKRAEWDSAWAFADGMRLQGLSVVPMPDMSDVTAQEARDCGAIVHAADVAAARADPRKACYFQATIEAARAPYYLACAIAVQVREQDEAIRRRAGA